MQQSREQNLWKQMNLRKKIKCRQKEILTSVLSQLLKQSLAHIYNSVMQMWEVFLRGVMSGSNVGRYPVRKSSKDFTTHIRLKTHVETD